MVNYLFPSVSSGLKLERRCPHCSRPNGNIHSGVYHRPISDPKVPSVPQRRMKCPWCNTTWTVQPDGISDGRQRSDMVISFGVLLYVLGLSYRHAARIIRAFGYKGSKSSIERDVAKAGQKARILRSQAPRLRVNILGVDGTGAKMAGKKRAGVLFFVDIHTGKLISVEPVKETDVKKVREHVLKVMREFGAEQLRTDELSVYEGIVPEQRHTICFAHWLKSKCRRARELYRQLKTEALIFESQNMLELVELLKQEPRSATVPPQIEHMVRRYINCRRGTLWKVNQLLQHIERTWEQVSNEGGDRTNNATERVIGLTYKIRAKTMRGFKSWDKALSHPYLSEYLRGDAGICDLRKVV
jgi:transposase-like protein